MLKLMYITNDPQVALIAEKNGVDRIWVDLEVLGKEERQHNMNTVKSKHSVDDIRKIAPLLTTSEMLVRVNPWNENSEDEIEQVIAAGAQLIMLPMWKSVEEVKQFIKCIDKRTKVVLLLETKEAEECLDEVLRLDGVDEIHIGINDLHLAYGVRFMFELLANGTVERIINKIKAVGIPCGFGGFAKIGDGLLPAEMIIIEHYRIGSTRAILSRTFLDNALVQDIDEVDRIFTENMKAVRMFEERIQIMSSEELEANRQEVVGKVSEIVNKYK